MANFKKQIKIPNPELQNSFDKNDLVSYIYQHFDEIINGKTEEDSAKKFDFKSCTNQKDHIKISNKDIWIFGYGSLVWKADFPYIDRKRGFISGYQRRFYQNSIDHRGTHEQPGRVVTLIPTSLDEDRVYGMAYRIAAQQKDEVLNHLDYREKNGYERCNLSFYEYPENDLSPEIDIIMYIATQKNASFAGDIWEIPLIAEQILISCGPSGSNREYLFNLVQAMSELFPDVVDEHLQELHTELQNLIEVEPQLLERSLKQKIAFIIMESKDIYHEDYKTNKQKIEVQLNELLEACKQIGWKEALLRNVYKPRT